MVENGATGSSVGVIPWASENLSAGGWSSDRVPRRPERTSDEMLRCAQSKRAGIEVYFVLREALEQGPFFSAAVGGFWSRSSHRRPGGLWRWSCRVTTVFRVQMKYL